jgi:pimeloyl-ACP methyl ester carboxylesterase
VTVHASEPDSARRLHRVRAETLVLWGAKDTYIPAQYARGFVSLIPKARAEIIEDAGQMVMLERPEQAFGAVFGFLLS